MAKIKKLLALILSICVICTVSVMSVSAANTDDDNDTSASQYITTVRKARPQSIIGTVFRKTSARSTPALR